MEIESSKRIEELRKEIEEVKGSIPREPESYHWYLHSHLNRLNEELALEIKYQDDPDAKRCSECGKIVDLNQCAVIFQNGERFYYCGRGCLCD